MLRFRRGWLALLVCVPLGLARPALAQQETATEPSVDEAARQLFAEGIEFVEAGDWVQAEERFRRVLALRSSHVVAYNLSSALLNLGRPVEAADLLRSIVRAADVDTATREAAQQLLLQTEPQIGTLTVRVSGDLSGVRFALDDKPLELTAQVQTISVDPGQHTVTAHRDKTPLAFERVTVGGIAALQAELAITLPARIAPEDALQRAPSKHTLRAPAAPPLTEPMPDPADPADSSDGSGFWWWAAGAAVVASAVLAVVLVSPSSGEAAPVQGDTNPPFVRGRVR